MDKPQRPPRWFRPAIWAGLAGATMVIVGVITMTAP